MFKWQAQIQGREDGCADARLRRGRRPRPDLVKAVLSNRYRDEYLQAYHHSFETQQRGLEREEAWNLARNSNLIAGSSVPKDRRFEQGWRDGFDGKDTPPNGLCHEEVLTYERGHRNGKQHRENEMAQKLRQMSRNQHSHSPQGNRGR